ncbi:MAG: hypothetical protein IPK13_26860 [Deltaproteobacteria bacterium]|nr:hypothetical protein [Deltaproteobacteria bacterium]
MLDEVGSRIRDRCAALTMLVSLSGCGLGTWFKETRFAFRPPDPVDLEQRLRSLPDAPNHRVDHFAVLIGAETELRHRGNLSMAYQVLIEQGYDRDEVFIFDSEGGTPFFPNTDVTTRASLSLLFDYLARVVEPHDTLLVYVTGHGRRVAADEESRGAAKRLGVSTVVLNPGEEVSQDEFVAWLEAVPVGVGIAFFDQCYFGQISSPKLCNWVTMTTSAEDETSHGVSFPRAFWNAFRATPSRSDAGPITVYEAFKRAMVADVATRLGQNRPRIAHACVNPAGLLLTGQSFTSQEDTKDDARALGQTLTPSDTEHGSDAQ